MNNKTIALPTKRYMTAEFKKTVIKQLEDISKRYDKPIRGNMVHERSIYD